jgi:putative endonuclease
MRCFVYILECVDGTYNTGLANDLEYRIWEHGQGIHPDAYTYSRRPIKLAWSQELGSYREAFQLEHQLKGWNHAKKEALVRGDFEAIHAIVKAERQRKEQRRGKTDASAPLRSARRDKDER